MFWRGVAEAVLAYFKGEADGPNSITDGLPVGLDDARAYGRLKDLKLVVEIIFEPGHRARFRIFVYGDGMSLAKEVALGSGLEVASPRTRISRVEASLH